MASSIRIQIYEADTSQRQFSSHFSQQCLVCKPDFECACYYYYDHAPGHFNPIARVAYYDHPQIISKIEFERLE